MISSSVFNSENDRFLSNSSSSNQLGALSEDKNSNEEYERARRIESAMQHEGKASWQMQAVLRREKEAVDLRHSFSYHI